MNTKKQLLRFKSDAKDAAISMTNASIQGSILIVKGVWIAKDGIPGGLSAMVFPRHQATLIRCICLVTNYRRHHRRNCFFWFAFEMRHRGYDLLVKRKP